MSRAELRSTSRPRISACLAAVASSVRNRPVQERTAVFGEVGLAGEIRAVSQSALRLREAAQMGFSRCIAPYGNCAPSDAPDGLEARWGEDSQRGARSPDLLVVVRLFNSVRYS